MRIGSSGKSGKRRILGRRGRVERTKIFGAVALGRCRVRNSRQPMVIDIGKQ